MPLLSGKRIKRIPTLKRRTVVKATTSKDTTRSRASSGSVVTNAKTKSQRASIAKPVARAPIRNNRSKSSSSMSKVTRKSPIGGASVGRTTSRTTVSSISKIVK